MIVISDTSAITSLLQIGRLELLLRLYEEVVIPEGFRISPNLKERLLSDVGE